MEHPETNTYGIPGASVTIDTVTRVSRLELEVSTGWAKSNPEYFTQAFLEFAADVMENELQNTKVSVARKGFITFTAW